MPCSPQDPNGYTDGRIVGILSTSALDFYVRHLLISIERAEKLALRV
jgi:hypothetical protein